MELCACAHVKVGWTTQKNPDGSTSGWWECLSECGAKFVPALDPSPEALARARELVDKYIPPALLLGNIAPIQNAIAQTIQEVEMIIYATLKRNRAKGSCLIGRGVGNESVAESSRNPPGRPLSRLHPLN